MVALSAVILIGSGVFALITLFSTIRMNNEWEESIILRLGRYHRTKGAGLFLVIPFIETTGTRDKRVLTLDIEQQEVITKDNISVSIDAVLFMKVIDVKKTFLNIEDYEYSVKQKSQVTLKSVAGKYDLDDLLAKKEKIAKEIKKEVDTDTDKWGVDIETVELQNIVLPGDMKRIMARQAEAERERRAVIIKSTGELEAAKNLRKASDELAKSPGAMELRRLETLTDISQDQSNTIVFAVPLETLKDTMKASAGLQVPKPAKKHPSEVIAETVETTEEDEEHEE